jgi:hypothetical protein
MQDKYWKFDNPEAFRFVSERDYEWPIGEDSLPKTLEILQDTDQFTCVRYARRGTIPFEEEQNADTALILATRKIESLTTNMQLLKTLLAIRKFDATTTPFSSYTAAAAGDWDTATFDNNYIQQDVQKMQRTIYLNSFGTVKPENMRLIIGVADAQAIAASDEIRELIKQQPGIMQYLTTGIPQQYSGPWYNLPAVLYGTPVMVLPTIRNAAEEGAADSIAFELDDKAIMCHLDSPGLMSYSTLTCFEFEPMKVETFPNPEKRVTGIHVVNNFVIKVTAAASAYIITDIHS